MARVIKVQPARLQKLRDAISKLNLSTPAHTDGENWYDSSSRWRTHEVIGGYLIYEKGEVVGWGATFHGDQEAHVFVHRNHRERGLGSRLVKRIKKEMPEREFCPWNEKTVDFFSKRKVNCTGRYL